MNLLSVAVKWTDPIYITAAWCHHMTSFKIIHLEIDNNIYYIVYKTMQAFVHFLFPASLLNHLLSFLFSLGA